MFPTKLRRLLLGLLCLIGGLHFLTLSPTQSLAEQGRPWKQHMQAGISAYRQGKFAEAEKQWTAGLEVAKSFGTHDPRYATSLSNLANLYRAQGRYGDAAPLYKRSIRIMEKTLGPEHRLVATSLNNLAELYRTQGRYDEAEPLYKRSLGIVEKTFGPKHSHVAQNLENFASMLRKTGRNTEAARIELRAKIIRANLPE